MKKRFIAILSVCLLSLLMSCSENTQKETSITVEIISPASNISVKNELLIQLSVSGAEPDSVKLLKNEKLLSTLSAPYTFVWKTDAEIEGDYVFSAVASKANKDYKSQPRVITLDRSPPKIISQQPVPLSNDAWVADPITINFNEEIREESISSQTINVKITGTDQSLAATSALENERRTLVITPLVPFEATSSITVTLNGVTDSLGNALDTSWEFSLPWWQQPDKPKRINNHTNEAFALSAIRLNDGTPVVAWNEYTLSTGQDIFVKMWSGSQWVSLGTEPLEIETSQYGVRPCLATNSRNSHVVVWYETTPQDFIWHINAKQWNGSSWEQVGDSFIGTVDTQFPIGGISCVLNEQNQLFVAWGGEGKSVLTTDTDHDAYVKAWDGTSWRLLGDQPINIDLLGSASRPSLALDNYGNPLVTWTEMVNRNPNIYVKHWDGNSWKLLGDALDNQLSSLSYDSSITADGANNFYVTWSESNNLYVKHWNGSGWASVGGLISKTSSVQYPSILVGQDQKPVVAWWENKTNVNLYVKKWNGTSWDILGDEKVASYPSSLGSYLEFSLALDTKGNPGIAWLPSGIEPSGINNNVYFKRFNSAN